MSGMDTGQRIQTLRIAGDLTARQLALLAGVAPSTVTRIEKGQRAASFDLVTELLEILGVPGPFGGTSGPDAILAARYAVDPDLPLSLTAGARTWTDRWARIGLTREDGSVVLGREADLLFRAGQAARLTSRPGALDFRGIGPWFEVARGLADTDLEWALTGDAAANIFTPSGTETWPVFYVSNMELAVTELDLRPRLSGPGDWLTLIPFDGVSEAGRIVDDGLWIADRDQVAIDCFGGIGRMREQAEAMMGVEVG